MQFFLPCARFSSHYFRMKYLISRVFTCCALTVALIVAFSPVSSLRADQQSMREADQKEISRLRNSLHEAHRELAEQKGRVGRVESELTRTKRDLAKANEELKKRADRGANEAKTSKREEAPGPKAAPVREVKTIEPKKVPQKPVPAPAVIKKQEPAPSSTKSFHIAYVQNSAVNYEARQKALVWVQEQIKKDKGAQFSITASANDSKYPEANLEIAENRARFLKAFLVQGGVPAAAIASAQAGKGKIGSQDTGRSALILLITPTGKAAPQAKPAPQVKSAAKQRK